MCVQLSHIGIPRDQVTWARVTLTSDKWISVRHDNRDDLSSRRATVGVYYIWKFKPTKKVLLTDFYEGEIKNVESINHVNQKKI